MQVVRGVVPLPALAALHKVLVAELPGHGRQTERCRCQAKLPDLPRQPVQLLLQRSFFSISHRNRFRVLGFRVYGLMFWDGPTAQPYGPSPVHVSVVGLICALIFTVHQQSRP